MRFDNFASASEHLGPEVLLQRRLRQDFRPIVHERDQELERFRRQVNLAVALGQLPRVEIQAERSKTDRRMAGFPPLW